MAEVLAVLVEHNVPLDEAIVLAASCTADRTLMKSAAALAAHVRQWGELMTRARAWPVSAAHCRLIAPGRGQLRSPTWRRTSLSPSALACAI